MSNKQHQRDLIIGLVAMACFMGILTGTAYGIFVLWTVGFEETGLKDWQDKEGWCQTYCGQAIKYGELCYAHCIQLRDYKFYQLHKPGKVLV
jgi:hypothetical protein